jgi:peptide subunit release factor 1 (eRF1)
VRIEIFENGTRAARPLDELLRRLVALPPRRMLSLYLNLRWRDEQQRDRVWLTVRDRLRDESDFAEPALRFTEARVRQFEDDGFGGAALFLGDGFSLAARTEVELPTLVAIDSFAVVRPLVAVAHGHERALVALAASDEVRVFELAMGRLSPAGQFVGELPHLGDRGGWSQLKMQHHRQWHVDTLHREAAASLTHLFDAAPARVLLGGVDEAVANLERELPKRVAEQTLRLDSLGKDDPARKVVAAAERALRAADHGEDREALAQVKTLACSGGRGALGYAQVIDAFNRARPMRLFVPDSSDRILGHCRQCGYLSVEAQNPCVVCGGETHRLDAAEALVRAAVAVGARVDVVDRALLDSVGGCAAELRF